MTRLTIDWKPDKSSDIPVYKQVVEYIRDKISTGEWPVQSKLPAQRALAEALGVNRSTVVTAMEELKAEGLIEAVVGSGTVICNNTWSVLTAASPPDWLSYVRSGTHQPNLPTIREINRAEHDPNVIRLGTGELSPELIPARAMEEIFQRLKGRLSHLGYSEPKGLLPLRQAISDHLRGIGIEASPSAILIVSGALQALQLVSVGILRQGSAVLVEKPSYLSSLHTFQSTHLRLTGIPMDAEGIRTDLIAQQTRANNAALLYTIPSYHNPTGTVMSERRREQLLHICERERLPILEDDVYGELWLDEPAPKPLKASDKNGLVLYVGSLSKTLSPGLRIGWLVGPEPVIERLADVKMQTDYGSSALSQWAAAEWLASGMYRQHLTQVRAALRHRREIALQALRKDFSDIASWQEPQGGFYIWLRIEQPVSMRELFSLALSQGILLNPGYVYDKTANQHLRLSYAYADTRQLQQALHRLARLVRECV
ncbi:PLP-dependent aminotransferase family protein [Brevibacillus sp. H7]|uniref:MocR-like pyridoxine biosynthesis transcription factor PdxR n=1 Tax=Brevibacillus sp. H7 TaxID=3349138 RepID=UPI00380EE108